MLTINEAGQKWFFDNVVVPYLNANIEENWDNVKHAWFQDIEQCVMDTFAGDHIIYEVNKYSTLDKRPFTFRMHDNFIHQYFDKRVIDETI